MEDAPPEKRHCAGNEVLKGLRDAWQTDLLDWVLPFWTKHSPDKEHGGFFTCLDEFGEVYDTTKYMWLNGRALYTFSRAAVEFKGKVSEETRSEWCAAARCGASFLDKAKGKAPGTSEEVLYFSTTREGVRLHFQRKPYSAVFYVQGMLQYWRLLLTLQREGATGHGEDAEYYLNAATDMFRSLRMWMADPVLCGRPQGLLPPDGKSVLGEVMCLASLALDFHKFLSEFPEAVKDPGLPERLAEYKALIKEAMSKVRLHYDPQRHILMEVVAEQGIDHSTPSGRLFNPGHSIEVAWFLLQMCEVCPDTSMEQLALDVLLGSLELGWDGDERAGGYGGILYMVDIAGKPLLDATVTNTDKLWWPHTEALIALTMAHVLRPKEPKWMEWLQRVQIYCYKYFADQVPGRGEWFGYLNRDGSPRHRCKGGNYKGAFHLPRALIMCIQAADAHLEK